MKILKLHIEDFGTLHDCDISFTPLLNEIVQENGWGKTTIATFIKAMFYGLATTTKKKLNENERKKYTPWQGGNFGGYLDFEIDGEEYRIERFFGDKDTFKLIDLKTGKESKKFSSNIGEEIFDLDSEAYERSTFIPQKEISNGITEKLSTKLINSIQGTDNSDSLDKALEILDNRRKFLRKQGNAGKIAELQVEIENINEEIDKLKQSANAIDILQKEIVKENDVINELELKKEKIVRQINNYSKNQKLIANKKYIEENQAKLEELQKKINDYKIILNGNDFNADEIKYFTKVNDNLLSQQTKLQTICENDQLNEKIVNLQTYFGKNIPTEEDINEKISLNEKLNNLNGEIALLKNKESSLPQTNTSNSGKKSKSFLISFLLSILFAGVGGVLFTFTTTFAIVSFVIAGISLLLTGFLYLKSYIEVKTTPNSPTLSIETLKNEINEKEEIAKKYQIEIDDFISNFEHQNENSLSFLYSLRSKVKELQDCQNKAIELNEKINEIKKYIAVASQEINSFVSKFNLPNPSSSNQEKFNLLEKVKEDFIEDNKLMQEILVNLQEFKKDNITINNVENIDINKIQEEERLLQEEIDLHRENKAKLVNKIDRIKSELENLDNLENQVEELKAEKDFYSQQLKNIVGAKKFLEKANDNLTAKYRDPMKNSLNKYLKYILQSNYQEYDVDTELKISYQKFGQARELDYLSKGYQGVVDLCIRFALVDCLFGKEKPFIILDDPFVNMDESKLNQALSLIKEFSKEYQIIYLVCHNSRINKN